MQLRRASAGFAYRQLLQIAPFEFISSRHIFFAFTSPEALLSLGMCFVSAFSLLLNGVTPVVSVLTRLRGTDDLYYLRSRFSKERIVAQRTEAPIGEIHQDLSEQARSPYQENIVPASDPVESNFGSYIVRSQDATRVAQRRPNALLFVGTTIAAAGLIFFVLTLPGSRYGFLDNATSSVPDLKADFWSSTIQLLPRLLMLIFIQVLEHFPVNMQHIRSF